MVELNSAAMNRAALKTTFRLAQGFRAPLAALLPKDEELRDLAAIPFTHEISLTGRRRRLLSTPQMGTALRAQALALRNQMRQLAQEAGVVLQDQDLDTHSKPQAEDICASSASLLAIAPPHNLTQAARAAHILAATDKLRALLIMPAHANMGTQIETQNKNGPIALFVDNAAQLEQLGEFATILQNHQNAKSDLAFILSPKEGGAHSSLNESGLYESDLRDAAQRLLGDETHNGAPTPAFYHLYDKSVRMAYDKNARMALLPKAELIAKAAHDLRAPIVVMPFEKILGEKILGEKTQDEKIQSATETAENAPAFLLQLIKRLRLPLLLVK